MDEIAIVILIYKICHISSCYYKLRQLRLHLQDARVGYLLKYFQDLKTIHNVFNIRLILCYQTRTYGIAGRPGKSAIYRMGWPDTTTGTRQDRVKAILQTAAMEKFNTGWSVRLTTAQVISREEEERERD